MSIQAVGWVLEHSKTTRLDRLVLISLANHAGDTWECWPSVDTIKRESGAARERSVQEALARLEAGEHITRTINGAPDNRIRADRRPTLYRILRPIERSHEMTPSVTPRSDGVTRSAKRGDAKQHDGVTLSDTQTISESSVESSVTPAATPPAPAGGQLDLGESTPARKDPARIASDSATARVTQAIWDGKDPRPTMPFVALWRIVAPLLKVGWTEDELKAAGAAAPVLTRAALELQLNQARNPTRGKPRGSTTSDGAAFDERIRSFRDRNRKKPPDGVTDPLDVKETTNGHP